MLLVPLTLLLPPTFEAPLEDPQPAVASESKWTTSISTFWTDPPHDSGYLSGILYADRGALHLEAHWAYEDRDTLSVFAGKNIPIEGDISGSFVPRIGYATGDSDGIVPALALELGWEALTFSTDIEWLIGTSSETDDFIYSWNEFTWDINERFTVGLVGQRTNVFDQELSVDRGFLFGVGFGQMRATAYFFNPDQDDPYFSLAFEAAF
jgi:hypothetical protein